jgi:hypothetical protein
MMDRKLPWRFPRNVKRLGEGVLSRGWRGQDKRAVLTRRLGQAFQRCSSEMRDPPVCCWLT